MEEGANLVSVGPQKDKLTNIGNSTYVMLFRFFFCIHVTFVFCLNMWKVSFFLADSEKTGEPTPLTVLVLCYCAYLILFCFDLQCFLWCPTDSNSLSVKRIAIAWTQQLFRIWDRIWPLPRCTSMHTTRRTRRLQLHSRCPSDGRYRVAFYVGKRKPL